MAILDGKKAAAELKEEVKIGLAEYYSKGAPKCNLAIIMVGDNPASEVYVRNKAKACEAVGIGGKLVKLSEKTTQKELELFIKAISNDKSVHGVLVQLPLPAHLDETRATELVPTQKDVDGFTAQSLGRLVVGEKGFLSCTPGGIIYLLKKYKIVLSGKHVVIIGRSKIVGKPMALALLNENCTVTVCHSKTRNLAKITKSADIIICAVGRPKFLTSDMVGFGAVVVDVGINRTEEGLVGDVDYEGVNKYASFITPVPGGVGPMTVAYLMKNTFDAYVNQLDGKYE
ncbi:MAG: bifunctional methylenetetrahydrofolate dehydrogenase/methenyltetrahydrofolate cyclohydrolase FolD [Clostridia bacterium]|nr:bifunctional methylenetetrahydrofolate dehydrogenase/methenyltetrahydrofolate cyclohydrolase FolD [Clostridia bacterium]